jgi:hypothetical protein
MARSVEVPLSIDDFQLWHQSDRFESPDNFPDDDEDLVSVSGKAFHNSSEQNGTPLARQQAITFRLSVRSSKCCASDLSLVEDDLVTRDGSFLRDPARITAKKLPCARQ